MVPMPQLRALSIIGMLVWCSSSLAFAQGANQSSAQTTADSSAYVEGHITCDDGGVPVRGAAVRLIPLAALLQSDNGKGSSGASGQGQEWPEGTTDFSGYYRLHPVRPGMYIMDARQDGYSNDLKLVRSVLDRFTLDQQKKLLATFPQITVGSAGSVVGDVVLHRAGAISGRVTVDSGGILGKTTVTAALVSSTLIGNADGGPGQKPVDFSLSASTDDRGVYRIAGLPEGEYRVSLHMIEGFWKPVMLPNGRYSGEPVRQGVGDLTVFAPEALTESSARLVHVGDDDELTDVDITIPMRLLHSIAGTVTRGGAPLAGAWLQVQQQGEKPREVPTETASMPDGTYRFDLLPAGTYTIAARYPNPVASERKSVMRKITVQVDDDDITDANVELLIGAP